MRSPLDAEVMYGIEGLLIVHASHSHTKARTRHAKSLLVLIISTHNIRKTLVSIIEQLECLLLEYL